MNARGGVYRIDAKPLPVKNNDGDLYIGFTFLKTTSSKITGAEREKVAQWDASCLGKITLDFLWFMFSVRFVCVYDVG